MALAVNKRTLPIVRDRESLFERDVRTTMRNLEDTLTAAIDEIDVTNDNLADMAGRTFKANALTTTSPPQDLTVPQARDLLGLRIAFMTSDLAFTTTSLGDVPELSFPVASRRRYHFKFTVALNSDAIANGPGLSVSIPSAVIFAASGTFTGRAADGTTATWSGSITASNDPVISDAVLAANNDYIFTVEGILVPNTSGTLTLRARSETGSATITLREGSCGFIWDLT